MHKMSQDLNRGTFSHKYAPNLNKNQFIFNFETRLNILDRIKVLSISKMRIILKPINVCTAIIQSDKMQDVSQSAHYNKRQYCIIARGLVQWPPLNTTVIITSWVWIFTLTPWHSHSMYVQTYRDGWTVSSKTVIIKSCNDDI